MALTVSLNRQGKAPIIYAIVIVAAGILLGCIVFIKVKDVRGWYINVALQLAAFAALGVLHVWMSAGKLTKFSMKRPAGRKHTLLLAASMLVALALLYTFLNVDVFRLCFAATAAFITPYIFAYCYNVFESIPDPQYKLWYKKDNLIDNKAFVFLASVPLKIKLAPSMMDNSYKVFKSTMPAQMELGRMFHFFLIQQQADDVVIDAKNQFNEPIGWQFYREKLWGLRLIPLNPDFNLWENQVKPGSTILAKRFILSSDRLPVQFQQTQQHELSQY